MINSVDNRSLAYTAPENERVPNKSLYQNDFIKLLTTQLANQSPLKPADSNQMLEQMAQITSVQTLMGVQDGMERLQQDGQITLGQSLIGKNVELLDPATGALKTGMVDRVILEDDTIHLQVGEARLPLSSLQSVLNIPTSSTGI